MCRGRHRRSDLPPGASGVARYGTARARQRRRRPREHKRVEHSRSAGERRRAPHHAPKRVSPPAGARPLVAAASSDRGAAALEPFTTSTENGGQDQTLSRANRPILTGVSSVKGGHDRTLLAGNCPVLTGIPPVDAQPELLWTPAWWGWVDGRYGFHPGYWGPEVGFYSGIDYGFGYTGEGYYGGRWDHGVFFYNRSVNNFTNVRITNVYDQTIGMNHNVSRVSFNGGNGDIQARPTPQQEAIARERHIEATPLQRQHAEIASKDRSLFSAEPRRACGRRDARPGVLQGEGVVRASRTPVAPVGKPGRPGGREELRGASCSTPVSRRVRASRRA